MQYQSRANTFEHLQLRLDMFLSPLVSCMGALLFSIAPISSSSFFFSHTPSLSVCMCVGMCGSCSLSVFRSIDGTHAKPHLLSYDSIRFESFASRFGVLLVCHCLISRETNRVSKQTQFCPSISTISPYALQLCLCKVATLLDSLPPHYFPHNLTMIS